MKAGMYCMVHYKTFLLSMKKYIYEGKNVLHGTSQSCKL